MKNLFTILFTFLCFSLVFSQEFEGVIVYDINYDYIPSDLKDIQDNLPKTSKLFIKDGLIKEIKESGNQKKITIKDISTGDYAVLFDLFGQKLAMRLNDNEKDKFIARNNQTKIQYKGKGKKILNYKCKEAIIIYPDNPNLELRIQYSNDFGIEDHFQFSNLKGFPLQYEVSIQGMKMTLTARKIENLTLKNFEFDIPPEYTKITSSDIKNIFSLTGL